MEDQPEPIQHHDSNVSSTGLAGGFFPQKMVLKNKLLVLGRDTQTMLRNPGFAKQEVTGLEGNMPGPDLCGLCMGTVVEGRSQE